MRFHTSGGIRIRYPDRRWSTVRRAHARGVGNAPADNNRSGSMRKRSFLAAAAVTVTAGLPGVPARRPSAGVTAGVVTREAGAGWVSHLYPRVKSNSRSSIPIVRSSATPVISTSLEVWRRRRLCPWRRHGELRQGQQYWYREPKPARRAAQAPGFPLQWLPRLPR